MQFWIKKNRTYIFVSLSLAMFFLVGNYIAKQKASKTTEKLISRLIIDNLQNKKDIFKRDFNNFSFYNTNKIVKNSKNQKEIILKLTQNISERFNYKNINDCFLFLLKNNKLDTLFLKSKNKLNLDFTTIKNNSTFKTNNINYLQKIAFYKINSTTKLIVGHTINLNNYWKNYSKTSSENPYYTIITDEKGICLLHPDINFIGKKINTIFNKISIDKILNNKNKFLKIKQKSNFLNLDIYRFFDVINTDNQQYILITNYPIDIFFNENVSDITKYFSLINFLGLLTFILIFIFFQRKLSKEYLKNLKKEREKKELAILNQKYKDKNSLLQLNQLKKVMNPHFLFNSLNSLSVLIDIDKDLSQKFILKLADVYRYFLENRKHNLTMVQKELDFLEQYYFLHKIRLNDSINLSILKNCSETTLQKKIPFLSLETLVENALKHNAYSKQNPLEIKCQINDNFIIISNNYNPIKTQNESHKIGLDYLKNCYEFYNNNEFKTFINDDIFYCQLPLLTI